MQPIETNIVLFELAQSIDPKQFLQRFEEDGIRMVSFGGQWIRIVTHLQFDDQMLERVLALLQAWTPSRH